MGLVHFLQSQRRLEAVKFVYFNHRLVGEGQTDTEIENAMLEMEDLIDLLDIREMLGEEQWYTVSEDSELGHIGPSELFDGGTLQGGWPV